MGDREEVEAGAMKIDGGNEVGFVAETAGGVFDPLNLRVDGFAGGIGDAVVQIGDDVFKAALDEFGFLPHRLQAAARGPVVPPVEVFASRAFIKVFKEGHHGFLQSPRPSRFQITVA